MISQHPHPHGQIHIQQSWDLELDQEIVLLGHGEQLVCEKAVPTWIHIYGAGAAGVPTDAGEGCWADAVPLWLWKGCFNICPKSVWKQQHTKTSVCTLEKQEVAGKAGSVLSLGYAWSRRGYTLASLRTHQSLTTQPTTVKTIS